MSTSQYPEHLNPFAEEVKPKKGLKLSSSFREFGRTIRQSFRKKKKAPPREEEVEIRHKPDTTFRRLPLTYAENKQLYLPAPLPRSRFHERVAKGHTYHGVTAAGNNSAPNPFDEGEESLREKSLRRKRKKRAPMPPNKSISSQDINEDRSDIPAHTSHWSLTSADSEFTYSTDNLSERDYHIDIDRLSLADDFTDFNKEMEKLNDDTNNNVINSKEAAVNNNIPDLVITCDCDNSKSDNEAEDGKPAGNNKSDEEDANGNISDSEPFHYNEKSIYIAGSRDCLDDSNDSGTYTGTVSLYITGSTDQLDNEHCEKLDDAKSDDETVPVPKQRKNKLTKSLLLGTDP